MTLLSLAKIVGGPGSLGFLAAASALGLCTIYVWPRRRTAGQLWLLSLAVLYFTLGLPVTARTISAPLDQPSRVQAAPALDTLIVFDGDNLGGREAEALRVWNVAHPDTVIVSGGGWLLDHLVAGGVSPERLRHDAASATTRDQVDFVARFQASRRYRRVGVVASRLQMPRIAALMCARGVQASLLASPVDRELPESGAWAYLPSYAALCISRDAFYERVALRYYSWRGWIPRPGEGGC